MSISSTVSSEDLARVSGGAGQSPSSPSSFDAYANKERAAVAPAYKQVVCTGAGVKGAPDLAKGVYGTGASDADKIRGAEMLKSYCLGGSQLPAAAPKTPF